MQNGNASMVKWLLCGSLVAVAVVMWLPGEDAPKRPSEPFESPFHPPNSDERRRAVGEGIHDDALRRAFTETSSFRPINMPGRSDWLARSDKDRDRKGPIFCGLQDWLA